MSAPRSSGATRAFDSRGSQEFRPLLRGRGRRKRSVPTCCSRRDPALNV